MIILAVVVALCIPAMLCMAACMLSSQISREEGE